MQLHPLEHVRYAGWLDYIHSLSSVNYSTIPERRGLFEESCVKTNISHPKPRVKVATGTRSSHQFQRTSQLQVTFDFSLEIVDYVMECLYKVWPPPARHMMSFVEN